MTVIQLTKSYTAINSLLAYFL